MRRQRPSSLGAQATRAFRSIPTVLEVARTRTVPMTVVAVVLVTVTERTREIGLGKSPGAPRRTVPMQFLIEAGLMSSVGAVAGVSLPVSGRSVAMALAVSSSVGLVFGYLPAIG